MLAFCATFIWLKKIWKINQTSRAQYQTNKLKCLKVMKSREKTWSAAMKSFSSARSTRSERFGISSERLGFW